MSHGLIEVNGRIEAAYAKERAWHDLGTVLEDVTDSEGMLAAAHLDFTIGKRPVSVDGVELDSHVATVREDTGAVLGIVSPNYGIMQTATMFDFLDGLVLDGVMQYESAGALHGGKSIWALARIGDDWTIGDDVHTPYILATTTHDGSGSVTVTPTTVRVVCQNTLSAAMWRQDALRVNIRHTSGVNERLRAAGEVLRVTTEDQRHMQEFLAKAQAERVSAEQVSVIVGELFGSRPIGDDATPRKLGSWERKLAGFREVARVELDANPTAYGLIQTITGFADHTMRPESKADLGPDRAFAAEFGGSGERFKRDAISIVREVVPALA